MKLLFLSAFLFCFKSAFVQEKPLPSQKYAITNDYVFDWDVKNKKFEKYKNLWPVENPQIEGVEERYLEITPTSMKIVEYYYHAFCSKRTRTFRFSTPKGKSKLNIDTARYNERGVYRDCDGVAETFSGTAHIESKDLSFEDLLNGKVKDGTVLFLWYYIPSKKEGEKIAIKIKK